MKILAYLQLILFIEFLCPLGSHGNHRIRRPNCLLASALTGSRRLCRVEEYYDRRKPSRRQPQSEPLANSSYSGFDRC
jgi:hypothetical protein